MQAAYHWWNSLLIWFISYHGAKSVSIVSNHLYFLMLEEPYFGSAFRVPGVGMSLNFSLTTLPPQGLLWHLQMFQNSYFRKQHDFISTPYFVAWVRHGFIRINSITGSTIENEWKFSIGKLYKRFNQRRWSLKQFIPLERGLCAILLYSRGW